ncbi:MAG: LysR family transcriptional regulator [Proteobacteria bacterium]|nr:LysR family transcriptional regulator [Burkholderiales bacterium]
MELRHLRYFLAIAERRSFSRAAERLHVSQPTLSEQIHRLEIELGVALFERLPRRVELTEAGTLFQQRCLRAMRELEAGQNEIADLQGLLRGTIRVALFHSFSASLLPAIVARFSGLYPAVHVVARLIPRDQMERELLAGEIDLAVAYLSSDTAHIVSEVLFDEPMRLIVNAMHPLARKRTLALRALDGLEMVLLTREFSARQYLDGLFANAGVVPRLLLEMNAIEPILATVLHSQLASVVAEGALHGRADLRAIRLTGPEPIRQGALLWRREGTRSAAALRFAALVREAYAARKSGDNRGED